MTTPGCAYILNDGTRCLNQAVMVQIDSTLGIILPICSTCAIITNPGIVLIASPLDTVAEASISEEPVLVANSTPIE